MSSGRAAEVLPAPRDLQPPESFARGSWPQLSPAYRRPLGEGVDDFPIWAARQYSQLITPIHHVLSSSSRVAVARRTNLSRNAVQSALDGAGWPQLQTIIRLGFVAGVELMSYSGRDFVDRGVPLPADEQALLRAYRHLGDASRQELHTRLQEHLSRPRQDRAGGPAVAGTSQADLAAKPR